METLVLNEESVNAYTELLTKPKAYGLEFPALSECFEEAKEPTPKHILFKQYIEYIKNDRVPKVMFYIIMDGLYPVGKAESGEAGYFLTIKSKEDEKTQPEQNDLGICKENNCQEKATTDYNGQGHYVCDYHDRRLNEYFDEEYK